MLKTLEGEGIVFDDILIDPSFPEDEIPRIVSLVRECSRNI